jgi:HMG (high mobility group) box
MLSLGSGPDARPLSSYNIYFQAERSKIVRENDIERASQESVARLTFEELGKIIGKRWKSLSDADRKKYDILADEEGERYRKEMDAFNEAKRRKRAETANLDRPLILKYPRVSMDTDEKRAAVSNQDAPDAPPPLCAFPVPPSTPVKARLPGCDGDHDPSLSYKPDASELLMPVLAAGPPEGTQRVVSWNSYQSQAPSPWQPRPTFRALPTTFTETLQADRPHNQGIPHARAFASASAPHRQENAFFRPPASYPHEAQPYLPVPPGMALFLPDASGQERKYVVTYNFYSMSRQEAEEYMKSLESSARGASDVAATMHPGPRTEVPSTRSPTYEPPSGRSKDPTQNSSAHPALLPSSPSSSLHSQAPRSQQVPPGAFWQT